MKKYFLLLIILFITKITFSQTKYNQGFKKGYKNGYCHDKGVGCIAPIAPIAPIPNVGESFDNYTDGYNRGFQMGLSTQKLNSSSSSNATNRTRYQTTKPKFSSDFVYQPNYELQYEVLNNLIKMKKRAEEEYFKGKYDNAIYLSKEILKKVPMQLAACQILSLCYLEKYYVFEKSSDLISAFNMSVKSDYISGDTSLSKIPTGLLNDYLIKYIKINDFSSIDQILSQINQTSYLASFWNGISSYFQKDYRKAKKYFKKIEDLDIDEVNKYLLSIKYKKYLPNPYISQQDDFENDDEKIVSNNKNLLSEKSNPTISNENINDYVNSGIMFYQKKEYYNAIQSFTKYLEFDNTNLDVFFFRAIAKTELRDYYGAQNDYNKILNLKNSYSMRINNIATVYNNKAYILLSQNKYKEAIPLIDKAISLDENKNYIWDTKGELEYHLGNYSGSVDAMSKALNIKPIANSYYFKGLSEIKLGNKEVGCSDLSKAGEMGESKAYTEIKSKCN